MKIKFLLEVVLKVQQQSHNHSLLPVQAALPQALVIQLKMLNMTWEKQ